MLVLLESGTTPALEGTHTAGLTPASAIADVGNANAVKPEVSRSIVIEEAVELLVTLSTLEGTLLISSIPNSEGTRKDTISPGVKSWLTVKVTTACAAWEMLLINLQRGYILLGMILSTRSEEHTSELQSQSNLVCRLLLEKKKKTKYTTTRTLAT